MTNPSAPRPAVGWLLIVAFVLSIMAAPVSADVILDEELAEYEYTGGSRTIEKTNAAPGTAPISRIYLKTIQNHPELYYILIDVEGGASALDDTPVTYTINGQTHTARRYISHSRNYAGVITRSRVAVYFDEDWDIGALTGTQYIEFSSPLFTGKGHTNCGYPVESNLAWVWGGPQTNLYRYEITVSSVKPWYNHLTIQEDLSDLYHLHLKRNYGTIYPSQIDLYNGPALQFSNAANTDFDYRFPRSSVNQITLNSGVNLYTWPLGSSGPTPTNATATVYVRSTQTGALISGANITIDDTTTDPWTEVANTTLASGTGAISLPKDTGLHFTQYKVTGSAPGYTQTVPALFFRLTGPTNVLVEMDPTSGGPVNATNTYLQFYVRDAAGNGIGAANVLVGDSLKYTNAQGYAQFEVPVNATYSYTVSKLRYTSVSGTATVLDADSYPVSVTLSAGAVPTYTPIPTDPGATPTPDTRTNEEKGQEVIDLIADFALPIAILAILATLSGLLSMMMPRRR
ncbi:MAG: hypothetical protein WC277_12080 [Bacilli bacterium]